MNDAEPNSPLDTPVRFLPRIGPDGAELLRQLGVVVVRDLLRLAPRTYHDLRRPLPLRELREGFLQRTVCRLEYAKLKTTRDGRHVVEAAFSDATGYLTATWFNRSNACDGLLLDREYEITGTMVRKNGRRSMSNPLVDPWPPPGEEPSPVADTMLPVYPLVEGLTQGRVRAAMAAALDRAAAAIPEPLPHAWRQARGLPTIAAAYRGLHFPKDRLAADQALRRLVYDEFLLLQTAFSRRRAAVRRQAAPRCPVAPAVDLRIRARIPFALTPAQDAAVADLAGDLARDQPMMRLLQGDVGSGKTAVAAYGLLAAVANGGQAALLAPTEILARQHFAALDGWLAGSRVRRLCYTGALNAADRAAGLAGLADGAVDLVVGTTALLWPAVAFRRLAFVCIDEQHKFGVRQRAALLDRTPPPHLLMTTATPIPRSLGLAWFGDLDLTILAGKPPGRQPVTTTVVMPAERARLFRELAACARRGERALVVCPRIDEGDAGAVRGVTETAARLRAQCGADHLVAELHGRMPDDAKEAALAGFRAGTPPLLVATTMVEVGVDVPEANLIVIEHAERFGLAQLAQLRGRVGRGGGAATCHAVLGTPSDAGRERLRIFAATDDGLALAEHDARNRGVGEFLGARQHGHGGRFGDFLRDLPILEEARRDAQALVAADPELQAPEWAALRNLLDAAHGSGELADAG